MRAEGYEANKQTLAGWPIRVVSYQLGARWSCRVDNVSPGATIARGEGASRQSAIDDALGRAESRLKLTRRVEVLERELESQKG